MTSSRQLLSLSMHNVNLPRQMPPKHRLKSSEQSITSDVLYVVHEDTSIEARNGADENGME
jgi:hypothetical protein